MNLEYFRPSSDVRKRNLNMSVKSSRSKKSRVEGIKSVGGTKNNDLKKYLYYQSGMMKNKVTFAPDLNPSISVRS